MPLPMTGADFIRATNDDRVQVRAEDGTLLGSVPRFADNIETLTCSTSQTVPVWTAAIRIVVVPYSQGVDPRTIAGFDPVPGLAEGPLILPGIVPEAPPARPRAARPPGDLTQGTQGDPEPI